jgi:HD domain
MPAWATALLPSHGVRALRSSSARESSEGAAPRPEPELEGLTNFLYEMGLLKRYKRTGWLVAGVDNPESIAEHSFRTAIIG